MDSRQNSGRLCFIVWDRNGRFCGPVTRSTTLPLSARVLRMDHFRARTLRDNRCPQHAFPLQAVSQPLRLRVACPRGREEEAIAQDYFNEDVGRALAFGGTAVMHEANNVLERISERYAGQSCCPPCAACAGTAEYEGAQETASAVGGSFSTFRS